MWNFGQSDLINCGQHKDESLGERLCEEVGAAIDKNGMDIEAIIREMSKTKLEVSKRKDDSERGVIRLEGKESRVALAKHLIKMKRRLQTSLLSKV